MTRGKVWTGNMVSVAIISAVTFVCTVLSVMSKARVFVMGKPSWAGPNPTSRVTRGLGITIH